MVYFKEEQRFNQWWMWLIISLTSFTVLGLAMNKIYNSSPSEPLQSNNLAYHWQVLILIGVVALVFLVAYGIFTAKLETEIKDRSIYYRFKPFVLSFKKIRAEDIASYQVREYSPIAEYGGWGYRYGFGNGKALNVKGNMGLQLKLKNGKKLLIGTQKPEEMDNVMKEMMNRKKEDHG